MTKIPPTSSVALLTALLAGCRAPAPAPDGWIRLLPAGGGLGSFATTDFGGEGEIRRDGNALHLGFGNPLTGVTWTGEFPRNEYEIALEATRLEGSDFFCCLTFPVDESCCSLVLGGWGGALVGLSCIDQADAADNDTTTYIRFETGRPYQVRLRVAGDRITAWLDDEPIVDFDAAGRWLSTRVEVARSEPMGVCSFATVARLSDLRYRRL